MIERLRILGALAGARGAATAAELASSSGVDASTVALLLAGEDFVEAVRDSGRDGPAHASAASYVLSGGRRRLQEELSGAFDSTERAMPGDVGTLDGEGREPSLGLVAAEDALRLELPLARTVAETRSILDRVRLDLELAEAEVADVSADHVRQRSALARRVEEARALLASMSVAVEFEEGLEALRVGSSSCTLVQWTAHDPSRPRGPALLYVDGLDGDGLGRTPAIRRDLACIVSAMGDGLHLTPRYVDLNTGTGQGHASQGRWASAGRPLTEGVARGDGCVYVIVRMDSEAGKVGARGFLDHQLETIRKLTRSTCLVLDNGFDLDVNSTVLHHHGIYQGCTAKIDDRALRNLAEVAFDWSRPRSPSRDCDLDADAF